MPPDLGPAWRQRVSMDQLNGNPNRCRRGWPRVLAPGLAMIDIRALEAGVENRMRRMFRDTEDSSAAPQLQACRELGIMHQTDFPVRVGLRSSSTRFPRLRGAP